MPCSKQTRTIPLQLLLVVPFVLEIFTIVGLVGYLSFRNGQKSVAYLTSQLQQEAGNRIDQHLDSYMAGPKQLTEMNAAALQAGLIDSTDADVLLQLFWQQVRSFETGFVLYGSATGQLESAGYIFEDRITIGYVNPDIHQNSHLYVWEADGQGRRSKTLVGDFGAYPFQQEDWYREAVKRQQLTWTPVYNWQAEPFSLAISISSPVYGADRQLEGVIASEQRLSQISDFLRQLKISPSSKTFIIERSGLLVGSSVDEEPFEVIDGKPQRLRASDSQDSQIQATTAHLLTHYGSLETIQSSAQLEFRYEGERQFVRVMPWKDALGIDWLVVVTVPESDFMTQIRANTRATLWLCLIALGIAVILGYYTARWITIPILRLSQASEKLAIAAQEGFSDSTQISQVSVNRIRELSTLAAVFNAMAKQLSASFMQLEYNAYHDGLTDLPNRAAFCLKLQTAIDQRQLVDLVTPSVKADPSSLFAILFLDLDYFKLVNDGLGHLVGDQLLIEVAKRLQHCVDAATPVAKTIKTSQQTILSRFGGDEFVILLDNITGLSEAIDLAEHISQTLQQPFLLNQDEVFISASIGIVLSNTGGDQPGSFLRNADIALYHAKAKGKAGYEVFDARMHTEAVERLQIETDLRRALEREELEVYYQPVVDLGTCQIRGFEALVRWRHPVHGMLSPARFIPVAEETGLIVKLGWWVFTQACLQMREWQRQFDCCQVMEMSINLSSKQFLQPDLFEQIELILIQTGLSRSCLKLEITESLLMSGGEATQAKLKRLNQSGIRLSIDDFGTGYSSLSYLHRFPIDTLKIDRSFISRIGSAENSLGIVEAIIVLAHKLGMTVVAEGIETEAQFEQLQIFGCEQAQGYLFSPAVPAAQIYSQLKTTVADAYSHELIRKPGGL